MEANAKCKCGRELQWVTRYGMADLMCPPCDAYQRTLCVHCGGAGGEARRDRRGIYYSRLCGKCWKARKSELR